MKKRTRASQKRLNNLLLILLLTAVLLIMSTYAWFTANRQVNIDSIDFKVSTSSGLQISADGKTWKTILDYQDIKNAGKDGNTASVNQLPELLAPTSTALEEDGGRLKMFYGQIDTDLNTGSATYGKYLLTSKLQTDRLSYNATGNKIQYNESGVEDDTSTYEYGLGYYFAFDIFLKETAGAENLYMSGSITQDPAKMADEKGLDNAVRVALIKGTDAAGVTADADNQSAVTALSTAGGSVMMWEPNYDTHTEKGIENGVGLGWVATGALSATDPTSNAQIPYAGVNKEVENVELSVATAAHASGAFTDMTPTWATKKSEIPSLEIPDGLTAGATKFRVYVWVEGQDIDCENYASGSDLIYNLSFSLDPYTAAPAPTPGP